MGNIYIGGDSFCGWRNRPEQDWPLILANKLNLRLTGQGFPGLSFWETRKHLLSYIDSPEFNNTEYFVFVHTDFTRMLNDQQQLIRLDSEIFKFYVKYLQSYDIDIWHMESWYKELNILLASKKVVNLFAFEISLRSADILNGIKLYPSLLELSMAEIGIDIKNPGRRLDKFIDDNRANHFSPENNQRLAEQVFQAIKWNQQENIITL